MKKAHETTLHGGVSMTMAKVRERFLVPRLRRLAKRLVKHCYGCMRFQAQPLHDPPPGDLPKSCTEGSTPFDVIGVDFAKPIKYGGKCKTEEKAYVVLYSCCLTRGIFQLRRGKISHDKSFKRLIDHPLSTQTTVLRSQLRQSG